jgi:hypothetical protein
VTIGAPRKSPDFCETCASGAERWVCAGCGFVHCYAPTCGMHGVPIHVPVAAGACVMLCARCESALA